MRQLCLKQTQCYQHKLAAWLTRQPDTMCGSHDDDDDCKLLTLLRCARLKVSALRVDDATA